MNTVTMNGLHKEGNGKETRKVKDTGQVKGADANDRDNQSYMRN
jgi:hypothetical protein